MPPTATCLRQSAPCPCSETNYIIHCAASIRFDEPISTIMHTNYACTRDLLNLAAGMPCLRCFTYMSTAYVNSNQPRHSRICEDIYPLPGAGDPLPHRPGAAGDAGEAGHKAGAPLAVQDGASQ